MAFLGSCEQNNFFLNFLKHFFGVVSSYVLGSLLKEYEEAFTVIKVIFSLYL
jgi:hypothetical protein